MSPKSECSRSGHVATQKGKAKSGAPKGNRNPAKGPRIGRKSKPATRSKLPLPQPRAEYTVPVHTQRSRPKAPGQGRNFAKGTNSHDGTVFRRGEDMLPRGNGLLMLKIIYHDKRQKLYDQVCGLIDESKPAALAFLQDYVDRTEGTATKRVETTTSLPREGRFVFTNKDGTTTPALPPLPVGSGSTPAADDEAMILGDATLESVRP